MKVDSTTLEEQLEQRGVTGVEGLVMGLGDDFNLEACLATIGRYDREGQDAPALLVYRVREAAKSKWRASPAKAAEPEATEPVAEGKVYLKHARLEGIHGQDAVRDAAARGESKSTKPGWVEEGEPCPGSLILEDTVPGRVWTATCDVCGLEVGVPPKMQRIP